MRPAPRGLGFGGGAAAVLAILAAALPALATPAVVETLDLRLIEGELARVDGAKVGIMLADSAVSEVPAAAVIRLRSAARLEQAKGINVVETTRGDELSAENLRIADSKVTFRNEMLGEVQLALSDVRAVYLLAGSATLSSVRQRCSQMQIAAGAADVLVLARKDNDISVLEGVLRSLADGEVVFHWRDEDRSFGMWTVPAILPAQSAGASRPAAGLHRVTGSDGSSIMCESVSSDDGATFGVNWLGGTAELGASDVSEIQFNCSSSATYLAEMPVAKVVEYGLLGAALGHRINASAAGGALRLGGREYPSGLGLRSFCELTYAIGGEYALLAAVVGINDKSRPRGDATLSVLGDGRPLCEPMRLTGKTPPQTLRISVKGVKDLTIRVDFGEDELDVADHVDLAAARLIK